jgi:hypothetical protein
MKTLQEFINKLNSIEKFQGWKLIDLPDKKKLSNLHGNLIVNEAVYKLDQVYSDKGPTTYLITTPGGNTYKNESYISKPFYDQIDLLAGLVYREYMNGNPIHYCIHNVVHDMSTARSMFENGAKHPTTYKQFTEKESYYYNTRMTYL